MQTNTNLIRPQDVVRVDLMLGNHGNGHRDFKLAGKVPWRGRDARRDRGRTAWDLRQGAAGWSMGRAPQAGYWTNLFRAPRSRGSTPWPSSGRTAYELPPLPATGAAKTFFVVAESLDRPRANNPGFDRPLGHELELVCVANPVTPMGPGVPIRVRLLYKGKPLAGERVSFIPRGATLAGPSTRNTSGRPTRGEASFEPTEANTLPITHKTEPKQGGTLDGKPYEFTKGTTLTVYAAFHYMLRRLI